jgi:hypothetical protein
MVVGRAPARVTVNAKALPGYQQDALLGQAMVRPRRQAAAGKSWEGWAILGLSAGLAFLTGAALFIYVSIRLQTAMANSLISLSAAACGGWAVMAGIWLAAYIWKIFLLRIQANRHFEMLQENFAGSGPLQLKLSVAPGVGLAVVSGMLALRKPQGVLALAGYAIGLVGGILIVALLVKPWTIME